MLKHILIATLAALSCTTPALACEYGLDNLRYDLGANYDCVVVRDELLDCGDLWLGLYPAEDEDGAVISGWFTVSSQRKGSRKWKHIWNAFCPCRGFSGNCELVQP